LPNIQTMDEAGLGSFPGGRVWWGMVVPAGTPDAVVQKLNADLVDIFRAPKFAEFAEKQFMETAAGSIDEFAAFLKDDRERAGVLVKRYMSQ
jgi:tripartite-type tricarboxylate transporter receptor subunit TctC